MSYLACLCLKTPAFLRREGRRKRKAGAKNEKAIIIIAVFAKRSTEKSQVRRFYPKKKPLQETTKAEKVTSPQKNCRAASPNCHLISFPPQALRNTL
jgi:hypothetical protein